MGLWSCDFVAMARQENFQYFLNNIFHKTCAVWQIFQLKDDTSVIGQCWYKEGYLILRYLLNVLSIFSMKGKYCYSGETFQSYQITFNGSTVFEVKTSLIQRRQILPWTTQSCCYPLVPTDKALNDVSFFSIKSEWPLVTQLYKPQSYMHSVLWQILFIYSIKTISNLLQSSHFIGFYLKGKNLSTYCFSKSCLPSDLVIFFHLLWRPANRYSTQISTRQKITFCKGSVQVVCQFINDIQSRIRCYF